MEGKLKFYRGAPKNFGFITGEDGTDYFFSISDLRESGVLGDNGGLGRGDRISFTPGQTPKGFKASNIKILQHAPR